MVCTASYKEKVQIISLQLAEKLWKPTKCCLKLALCFLLVFHVPASIVTTLHSFKVQEI